MESNNPQIRWKALPSSEKAYFKQLSDEDAKRVRLEQGLEDKENKAPAKKRSKKADKENDTPVMKRAKMEVLKEDQGAPKESAMFLESNNQEGDHVREESIATEEIAEVNSNVMGDRSVLEGIGVLEGTDNPGAVTVEIEFGGEEMDSSVNVGGISASDCNTIGAVTNGDVLSRDEDAHVENGEEEENSEEELERSLAAEMYEVTVEENMRPDEAIEEEGADANVKSGLQQDTLEGGAGQQSCGIVQDVAARTDLLQTNDSLDLMQVSEADDEVGKGEDGDWQWEEMEEDGDGEAVAEVVKASLEEVEFDQEVEEVGCTFEKNGASRKGGDDPENRKEQAKHKVEESKSTGLESNGVGRACLGENWAKISFVKDAVAEDSMWDWEEPEEENLREEMPKEELREGELRGEEGKGELKEGELRGEEGEGVRELRSLEEPRGEELKDVMTISIQDCTVLNLDVVLDAPQIFNIPGNFKELVSDEFSPPPPSKSKPTKRKGRPAKTSGRKRSRRS